jgi:N-acetylneuraminic acid mutarotase
MEEAMRGLRITITVFVVLCVAAATAVTASSTPTRSGTWRLLPAPPIAITAANPSSVWTGSRVILFGRKQITALDKDGHPYVVKSVDAAAAFDPATNRWTRLGPPAGPGYVPAYRVVWTGTRLLAFGVFHSVSYDPVANTWRALPKAINLGFVAWTGREAIGWGGGCCGDAQSDGSAYNPATGVYRTLAAGPLGPAQGALGAWTGRELILFISRDDVHGKPRPAAVATAAAYNPATNTWRRIAPPPWRPQGGYPMGTGVWDGRELIVVGAGAKARSAYAYDPAANRWRTLASLPAPRLGGIGIWAGTRLLVVGGQNMGATKGLRDGISYDPKTNHWTRLPVLPLHDLYGATAVWAGRELLVTNQGRAAAYTPAGA